MVLRSKALSLDSHKEVRLSSAPCALRGSHGYSNTRSGRSDVTAERNESCPDLLRFEGVDGRWLCTALRMI